MTSLALFVSCSNLGSKLWSASESVPGERVPRITKQVATSSEPRVPFGLKVLSEANDGSKLYVLAEIEAYSRWDLEQVVLRGTTLRDGKIVEVKDIPLKEKAKSRYLEVDKPVRYSLTLGAEDVTDYQVGLLWGDEAPLSRQVRKPIEPKIELVRVQTKRELHCDFEPCEVAYTIIGEVLNSGEVDVRGATLGIRFEGSGELLGKEELISVTKLKLQPGQKKNIRLALKKRMTAKERDQFTPEIRVISARTVAKTEGA